MEKAFGIDDNELEKIDIHELLPQQEPFVMIDQLIHFDEKKTTTETTIKEENIFVDEGVMTSCGLIENIAQTCAARIGYVNKYILKKGIKIGFIGAVNGLEVKRRPHIGERITTEMEVKEEVFGMTLTHVEIKSGDETLVTTDIKIAIKE